MADAFLPSNARHWGLSLLPQLGIFFILCVTPFHPVFEAENLFPQPNAPRAFSRKILVKGGELPPFVFHL